MAVKHSPRNPNAAGPQHERPRMQSTQQIARREDDEVRLRDMRQTLAKLEVEFSRALSRAIDVKQFTRVAMTVYQTGSDLLECDPRTFIAACMQAAQLGLSVDPTLGEFYLIPRWNKHLGCKTVTTQIGYQGLLKRVRRSPLVDVIDAAVVRDGDGFEVVQGTTASLRHVPNLRDKPGDIIAAWALCRFKSGATVFRVLPKWEIDAARSRSDSKSGPWVTDYAAMAMKTALRRLCKVIPTDDATRSLVFNEERDEAREFIDVGFVVSQSGEQGDRDERSDEGETPKIAECNPGEDPAGDSGKEETDADRLQ